MVTQDVNNLKQGAQLSFRNNFWNGEIGNFAGFEILVKRLKDDRSVAKEYAEFLRQRCLIEEHYGKALIKLAKSCSGKDEMGCIRDAWDSVRSHTETIGQNHVQASSQLAVEVGKVTEFLDSSRDRRRWAEDGVRGLQTSLKAASKRVMEVKRGYEARAREEIQANHTYHQEVSRSGRDTSVAERAHGRHAKSVAGLEQSEEAYKEAVEALDKARVSWQTETETAVDTFQELARERLRVMRDGAWVAANISSACAVQDDAALEDTRQVLEDSHSDLEAVLGSWIERNMTSGDQGPPEAVTCEWRPTSATLGMGHMASQQQLSYDTASLGRASELRGQEPASPSPGGAASQSCTHLADVGRSRSDLGYTRPPAPQPPPMMSPKKPPRMYQYSNNNNSALGNRRSVAENKQSVNVPISVENGEYFGLSSSDYHSDMSLSDHSPRGRSVTRADMTPVTRHDRHLSVDRERHDTRHDMRHDMTRHQSVDRLRQHTGAWDRSRQAMVLCDYKRKHFTEISLSKNTIVRVLDGMPHSDWWRVETDQGSSGFYPSNYLRHI